MKCLTIKYILILLYILYDHAYGELIKDEEQAKQYLVEVNEKLAEAMRKLIAAQWAYMTDLNEQTSQAQVSDMSSLNDKCLHHSLHTTADLIADESREGVQ